MKVVLDTNVVVFGILTDHGPPARIVDLWMDGQLEVVASPPIITEYLGVLLCPKFFAVGPPKVRQSIVEDLVSLPSTVLAVPEQERAIELARGVVSEDPTDFMFLDCACARQVDFIVTGDRYLLDLKEYEGIPIVTPARLLQHVR